MKRRAAVHAKASTSRPLEDFSGDGLTDMNEKATSIGDLVAYFEEGIKPEADLLIGTECEALGLLRDDGGRLIPYSGEKSVTAVLERLAAEDGWNPVMEGKHITALTRGKAMVTLEPGGQVEFSSSPWPDLHDLHREFTLFWRRLLSLGRSMGIRFIGLGMHPFQLPDEIRWVPKRRYEIMSPFLGARGKLAHYMMKLTATCQSTVDFTGEADAMEKLRVAFGVAPVILALFANSPIRGGKPSGYRSFRGHVWLHTDPSRCGYVKGLLEAGDSFGFEDYCRHVMEVPMIFIQRAGGWIGGGGMNFREYMERGLEEHRATLADWDLHCSTLFTEARMKRYIEVRSADNPGLDLAFTLPALVKGIFYDAEARAAAWELAERLDLPNIEAVHEEVARDGLEAKVKNGGLMRDLAGELISAARGGLERQGGGEAAYIEPLEEWFALENRARADKFLDNWRKFYAEDFSLLYDDDDRRIAGIVG